MELHGLQPSTHYTAQIQAVSYWGQNRLKSSRAHLSFITASSTSKIWFDFCILIKIYMNVWKVPIIKLHNEQFSDWEPILIFNQFLPSLNWKGCKWRGVRNKIFALFKRLDSGPLLLPWISGAVDNCSTAEPLKTQKTFFGKESVLSEMLSSYGDFDFATWVHEVNLSQRQHISALYPELIWVQQERV